MRSGGDGGGISGRNRRFAARIRVRNALAEVHPDAISHTPRLPPVIPDPSAMTADLHPLPVPEQGAVRRVLPVSRNMKSDLIDKAAKIIPHPPILINLVSRRVRQLNQGRAPLINTANYGPRLGQGDIALIEIIEGYISAEMLSTPDEDV